MKEMDLGRFQTIHFDEQNDILGFDKKFLKLNDGKPLEFQAKINKEGQLVLLGPKLMKPSKIGVNFENKPKFIKC